jgi:hypothetical protein
MNMNSRQVTWNRDGWPAVPFWLVAVLICCLLAISPAYAVPGSITLQVQDNSGAPISGFRWLLEEDHTTAVDPGVHTTDTISLKFHTSHSPVLQQGETAGTSATITGVDTDKRYFVSVLPFSGHSNGGGEVVFDPATAAANMNVTVSAHPIPTAQITILAFEDKHPINNAPDQPQEPGLPGFSVLLFDAAGQYGAAGGQLLQDAFGNPIGTSYNPDGSVAAMGNGVVLTDADGLATIKNLAPGKYGVQLVPPAGQDWHQTHTIEGTKTVDAWVKPNEPAYFTEFGPPGYHVFIGFVKSFDCYNAAATNPAGYCDTAQPPGTSSISGVVTNLHTSRPPNFTFYSGHPFPGCWIGLNDAPAGLGRGVYAQPCNEDSSFQINNVPPGDYELVIWDTALDIIISTLPVTVPVGGGNIALGDVPVFGWFHRSEHSVFFDRNQNGFRDCVTAECNDPNLDDAPLGADQAAINLRFRDGRVYQAFPVDINGEAPFDEVFPFFSWLVAEVDFAKLKATGVTVTVDDGGPVAAGEVLNPQPQNCTQGDVDAGFCTAAELGNPLINPNTGDNLSRTETGPVLTQAFQGFLGQTNRFEWGKTNYATGENGGISGVVFYAVTRAENDPRYAVGEEWEPGIPRVQVSLYQSDIDGNILDQNGDAVITPPDVDNYPLGWSEGGAMGPEDVDNNGNGLFDLGDALRITHTDSWDDNLPSGCQGEVFSVDGVPTDCYDGLRNFNQVRPGVFDGGYAFGPGDPADPADPPLPAGDYVVEVSVPPGYELLKEEDKNVDFGAPYTPSPLLLPKTCVGELHTVPQYLSFQTDATGAPYPGIAPADLIDAPYANTSRPLCDRKYVPLAQGQNAAADFFLFTETPKASMVIGFILNDLANEFDPNAPTFGEKFAPSWLPVAIRDWTGREIGRTYSDEWGVYNAMLPSTYSVNLPMASGVSPNMATACMNDAGPIPNPDYDPVTNPTAPQQIVDPRYDRRFSQFCYTFQYMPGGTTYLDTPVVPIAAFAGPGGPLDCEQPAGTPLIYTVSGPNGSGPYVEPGQLLTIVALGDQAVPNPAYDGTTATTPTVVRHYGFGATAGEVSIGGVPLTGVSWSDGIITGTVPGGAATGQLTVTTAAGESAPGGVTVTVGPLPGRMSVIPVMPSADPLATPIQDAIDMARPQDIIMLAPGTYDEMVLMYKPVRLQGWGPYASVIDGRPLPAEKLTNWRNKVNTLLSAGAFDLVPGQAAGNPAVMFGGEGAGITVLGSLTLRTRLQFRPGEHHARIDGIGITGAEQGGAIQVNGHANSLEISNNRLVANMGQYGGGIRIGHAILTTEDPTLGTIYTDADNDRLNIHHNQVVQNGGLDGVGGGISLYTGSNRYSVTSNYICGNFTQGSGGGIGHLGLSWLGRIADNKVLFNQSFDQMAPVSGGGIYIGGQTGLAGGTSAVSPGSGPVTIDGNLIQGNQAGAGDGGGVSIERANGQDIERRPAGVNNWYAIDVLNNIIANNMAGLAGGGVAMQDAVKVNIVNNTIANNDSTATSGQAFAPGSPNASTAQPAGIVARANSAQLGGLIYPSTALDQYREFSNPTLVNNIVWHNRSFYWAIQPDPANPAQSIFGLVPDVGAGAPPVYDDLAVLGVTGSMNPRNSILTDVTGYDPSNIAADPAFMAGYINGDRGQTILMPELTTSVATAPAFDEGGNYIDVSFGPLTPSGNYHLSAGSPAIDAGDGAVLADHTELGIDYDAEPRPSGAGTDIGADELP